VPKEYARLLLISLVICLSACHQKTKSISFYFWRTTYAPDSTEINALKEYEVHTLYVHYFDVDWPDTDATPQPVSPIRFDTMPTGYAVVPVIFFHNRVFDKLDSTSSKTLTEKVLSLVHRIDVSAHLEPTELQFDCDWTEHSRDNYFRFIRQYHTLSGLPLSSTIRLSQIKYSDKTGIPPVDHGILLFYNMGNTDTGAGNFNYDRAIAHRYTPSLRTYPLLLDLALPIFQHPRPNDLLDMVDDVNRHSNQKIRNLIFFDLDHQNLQQYDKDLFKEVLDHTE
jgi:hypothetical protein